MVRILSSGEIVADNDPRAQQVDSTSKAKNVLPRRDAASSSQFHQQAMRADGGDAQQQSRGMFGQDQATQMGQNSGPFAGQQNTVSLYDTVNNKLLELGIPRIPVSGYIIEPIIAVAVVLALLFFGLPGLIIIAIIFLLKEVSRGDSPIARGLNSFLGGANTAPAPPARGNNSTPAVGNSGNSATRPGQKGFKGNGQRLGGN